MDSVDFLQVGVSALAGTLAALFFLGILSIKLFRLAIRVKDLERLQLRDVAREKVGKRWEKHRQHEDEAQAISQELGLNQAKRREERYANDPLPLN